MENQNFFQKNKGLVILIGLVVIVFFWAMSGYNRFVSLNESVNGQWAQVENQLQRRFDLVPNLVSTVKGITTQEQKVFGDIADARTRYAGATNTNDKALAAGQFESALGRLLVITENYPNLQSSQSFRDLMVQLEGTENRISVERMKYNDLVKSFNVGVKIFPSSLIASIFKFQEKTYFEVAEVAKTAPKVDFTN
jgi:LemA protein